VHLIEVDGVMHRVSRDEGGVLRSPAPALVVATPVAVGDEVEAGAPVVVLESMKMETIVSAPFTARVKEVLVKTGTQVETGAALVKLEPVGEDDQLVEATMLDLSRPKAVSRGNGAAGLHRAHDVLEGMLLGFDVEGAAAATALREYLGAREHLVGQGNSPLLDDVELLRVFADFAELSRNRPADGDPHDETRIHSPREHFQGFLRTLDVERAGLPPAFRERLARVLGHYDLPGDRTAPERTPDLEAALFRIFLAQQRSLPEARMATALLRRWLAEPAPHDGLTQAAREVLDRLIVATQVRFPIVGDLARSVRFRWFDQPAVDADRSATLAAIGPELDELDALPEGPERTARLEALADIPERIVSFLGDRLRSGTPRSEPMLAVLIRRHYREHDLSAVQEYAVDGRPFACADYRLDRRDTHLITTLGRLEELAPDAALTRALTREVEAALSRDDAQIALDLYVHAPELPADPDEAAGVLAATFAALPFTGRVRRIAVGVVRDAATEIGYVTLRPQPDGTVVEDRPVRDVHPMVGRRLNLWRLRGFSITRLEAPPDVLLLHCAGIDNPHDQRLVALAQVRQLTLVRDEHGQVTGLPHVERAIAQCLDAIRRARGALATKDIRLDMNHVWIHIWPPVDADIDQLTALRGKIAPLTAGAGIDEVRVEGRIAAAGTRTVPVVARFTSQPGSGVDFTIEPPATARVPTLDAYAEKVIRARRRGLVYPYELQSFIAGEDGTAVELDLDAAGALVPVDRLPGHNHSGIVCARVSTPTELHPEGIDRVLLCGDPLRSLGSVAEPECARIIAALDLAEELRVPVEWFALSAGARIAMDSGTENMDWVARALRRIVEFTQAGGEINIVVAGINVGAQPYWNAEATM
ncbi:MAG: acetyl-CoA carboxylase biotin carboxyl carrier protein subunit, partial [Tetrasphaera sp.]|nr:acetyl-CoA carboxylase biotin carboxyl carrier protein subunit [Tetrasphaera sp.]